MLLAYASVPTLMDFLAPFVPTPPHGYAATTVSLLPAAWIVWRICRRQRERLGAAVSKGRLPAWTDIRSNVTRLPVALLLVLNMSYFISYSSLFPLQGICAAARARECGGLFHGPSGVNDPHPAPRGRCSTCLIKQGWWESASLSLPWDS